MHNDFRAANILTRDSKVDGVLDFDDVFLDHRGSDLAKASTYLGTRFTLWSSTPVTAQQELRAGYESVQPLSPAEVAWLNGTVLSHHAFGFFVNLAETVNGLVEAPCIMDLRPGEDGHSDDFPAVGADIEAVVLGIAEHNRQIWLSMRPSDLARDSCEPDPAED